MKYLEGIKSSIFSIGQYHHARPIVTGDADDDNDTGDQSVKYQVHIEDTGEVYRCDERNSVLVGMEALGRRGIPVGCRNGGCGVCKVEITAGQYVARVMSREHVSAEDEACGRVLACRVRPDSDLSLKVIGQMKKSVCRTVETAPAQGSLST